MKTRILRRAILTVCLTILGSAVANSADAHTPTVIRETESSISGTFYGTLVSDGAGGYSARWGNGALATFRVTYFDGRRIILSRYDYAGASAGLRGTYDGIVVGNTIRGRTTWTHKGSTWNGTFSASW